MMKAADVVAAYGVLVERAVAVLEARGKNWPDADEPLRLVVEGDQVVVEWQECRYEDGMETERERVPVGVLEMAEEAFEDWVETTKRRRAAEKAEVARAREVMERRAQEAAELALWERLKAKYGEGSR